MLVPMCMRIVQVRWSFKWLKMKIDETVHAFYAYGRNFLRTLSEDRNVHRRLTIKRWVC
mgnify:CR=1 FL=1